MIYLGTVAADVGAADRFLAAERRRGRIWGAIPAVFKARYGTNETLFTLMMNYVAIQLTSFFVAKWENPFGSNTVGIINQQTKAGWFPAVFGQKYLLNVIIVLVLTVADVHLSALLQAGV